MHSVSLKNNCSAKISKNSLFYLTSLLTWTFENIKFALFKLCLVVPIKNSCHINKINWNAYLAWRCENNSWQRRLVSSPQVLECIDRSGARHTHIRLSQPISWHRIALQVADVSLQIFPRLLHTHTCPAQWTSCHSSSKFSFLGRQARPVC